MFDTICHCITSQNYLDGLLVHLICFLYYYPIYFLYVSYILLYTYRYLTGISVVQSCVICISQIIRKENVVNKNIYWIKHVLPCHCCHYTAPFGGFIITFIISVYLLNNFHEVNKDDHFFISQAILHCAYQVTIKPREGELMEVVGICFQSLKLPRWNSANERGWKDCDIRFITMLEHH